MGSLLGGSKVQRTENEPPPLLLRLTNLLGYLFLILVNVLSSIGAFGGTNGEISAKFPTPLTPAGWAFSIWGVIFALEGLGVVYQLLNNGYRDGGWKSTVIMKIGYGWQLGWLAQDLWQIFFVRESVLGMWLAAVALLAALAAFQVALHRLNGTTGELRARGYANMPAAGYAFYKLPTAINAAWLSVAAALGLLIVPVSYGAAQSSLVAPAAVLAVVVTAGGVWRLAFHRDAAYGLTLIWALAAVASNNSGNVPRAVKVVGIVCVALLALFVVAALVRTHREVAAAAPGAAAATDAEGALLGSPYGGYGSYSDRRVLLSDSDAFAGGTGGGSPGSAAGGSFTSSDAGSGGGSGGGAGGHGYGYGVAGAPASATTGVAFIGPSGFGIGSGAGAAGLLQGAATTHARNDGGLGGPAAGQLQGGLGSITGARAAQHGAGDGAQGDVEAPGAWAPGGGGEGQAARGGVGGAGSGGGGGGGGRRVRFQLEEDQAAPERR